MSSSVRAREILASASSVLDQIGQAKIFKTVEQREFPTFVRNELGLGPMLGVGGSCTVREVAATRLRRNGEDLPPSVDMNEGGADGPDYEDAHLDVSTARQFIASHCLRDGEARYAVKKLRTDLDEVAQASAILDLAIEAKLLTVISHPNIIKMRGLAEGNPMRKEYFIVLDRLYGTLSDKEEEWKAERKRHKGFFRIGENKEKLNKLLLAQLLTAYDLSAAFRYLHDHNMVYRDIKPENIGFDVRGDVKVFDFGLSRELLPILKKKDGLYKLTPRTGTPPYMAPEVALSDPYGKAADVYAYAVLVWEMLSLKPAYEGYDPRKYHQRVILGGTTLEVSDAWPPFTRQIMKEGLSHKSQERPDFTRIASVLRGDLATLTDDETIIYRDQHMMERSQRSYSERSQHSERSAQSGQSYPSQNPEESYHEGEPEEDEDRVEDE